MTTATATKTSLKNFIALIPSRSVRQMLAIFSGIEFLKTVSRIRKRKRKSVHAFHKTWNYACSRRSRAVTAEKCSKKRDAVQSCCFANLNLLLFLPFLLTSPLSSLIVIMKPTFDVLSERIKLFGCTVKCVDGYCWSEWTSTRKS